MSTIQIRIDEGTKKSAKKIFDDVGIDMSSAIKVYLKQVIINKGIPFKLVTENGMTISQENRILDASVDANAGKNVRTFNDWKEVKSYLNSLK